MRAELTFNFKKLMLALVGIFLLIIALHIITQYIRFSGVKENSLINLFNLGLERNIPTFYSSLSLLFCSFLLGLIALHHKQNKNKFVKHWIILSLIFFFLSVDEMLMFHEHFIEPVRKLLNTGSYLFFAWIIPYSLMLVILFFYYFRFLLSIPPIIRRLFILSAAIFISGAIGIEMLGAKHFENFGRDDVYYTLYQSIEEILEMTGILIFIYALTTYIQTIMNSLVINFKKPDF